MAQGYLADVVTDGQGKPVVGATVRLLRASDYASPPVVDPGPGGLLVLTTTTGSGGQYVFDNIRPEVYHVCVVYRGVTTFRYWVSVLPSDQVRSLDRESRVLVPRTLEKLLSGEGVVVHCVGDSVTVGFNATGVVGGGFVQRLAVLIGQQIVPLAQVDRYDPNAYGSLSDGPINGWTGPTHVQVASGGSSQVVQVVNNGVSGDTVQRVLRRMTNLTGWTPAVDLFVIFLGINDSLTTDGTKFVDPASYYAGVHSLVEILRNYYPQAELAICTPHHNDQPDAGGVYTLEQYAMGGRRAAVETGVALVDLRQLWADKFNANDPGFASNDGYGTWLSTAGGNHTHPTDDGHQGLAEEIFKLFGSPGLWAGRAQRVQTLGPRRHFKELEVLRLPNSNPALVFAGGGWSADGGGGLGAFYYSSGLQKASAVGNTLTWTGRCQDVSLFVRRGRDCGRLSVAVDGGSAVQYDLYRAYPADISDTVEASAVYPMDRLVVARGLADGEHTVVVTVLGTKTVASSGTVIYVDALEVTRWGYTARKLECPIEGSQMQYGAFTATLAASYFGTVALVFPRAFRSGTVPTVVASANQIDHYCTVDAITNVGCNIRMVHRDGTNESLAVTGQWVAVG